MFSGKFSLIFNKSSLGFFLIAIKFLIEHKIECTFFSYLRHLNILNKTCEIGYEFEIKFYRNSL